MLDTVLKGDAVMDLDFDMEIFKTEMKAKKEYVDKNLKKLLTAEDTHPPVIHQAMHYAVFNGGKRLRPIMVLESARLAGGTPESVMPTACAIELIHSYSLVHDDLPAMDNDDYRRGKLTCHKVFGEANGILTGDALLTAGFEFMAKNSEVDGIKPLNVIKVIKEVAFAVGSQGMIGGQVMDLEAENRVIDYDTLQTLHSLKTGRLFRAALTAGAILNDMNNDGLDSLRQYAHNFGLAFQITDDILDIKGDAALLGKPIGSDEKNHKTTYPSLFGLERSQELAVQSVNACIKSLSGFGAEADFLRRLALFVLYRQN
ncbi:MAG: polyprenyl synthetase family protein [Syntrophomonadaceae bacterium]|jgi:geranylgeranyl diphosphate synthase type II